MGDIAQCYVDASLAERNWAGRIERGIAEMCKNAWNLKEENPRGYED